MANKSALDKSVGEHLASLIPAHQRAWYRVPSLIWLNLLLFNCMLFASVVGYDTAMVSSLQALHQWQDFMNFPTGAYLGGVFAIQSAGSCITYPIMSLVANKYGRKLPLYAGYIFIILGMGLQTGARNPGMFIASRLFVGASSGFFGAAPLLITELAYPTHRAKLTSMYNTFFYVGGLLSAWAIYGTRNLNDWAWRVPSLLQIAFPAIAFLGLLCIPESPRYFVSVGRMEKARAILVRCHAAGDNTSALVNFEMAEIEQALALERVYDRSRYADMFKTKGNRHRLFISVSIGVFAQWNGVGVIGYYLPLILTSVGVTSVTDQTLISGFLQLFNLIVAVSSASLVDRVGRRVLFMTSCIGMLCCYIVVTGLSAIFAEDSSKSAVGIAVIPMLFLYFGFYDIAFTPFVVSYPAEIWPYELRSKGVTVAQFSSFAALFFNLFVNPIALENIAWKYYLVYVVLLVILCFICWFGYPETRGHTLEEMARVFDGDSAPGTLTREVVDNALNEKGVVIEQVEDA